VPNYLNRVSLLPLVLVFACAAGDKSTQPPANETFAASPSDSLGARFPAPKSALTIDAKSEKSLDDLLADVSRSTGVVFSIDENTVRPMLRKAHVSISQPVTIETGSVYPWFESLLTQHGFYLASLTDAAPPLVAVYARNSPQSHVGSPPSLAVPADRIDFCRQHPALLVTTTVDLPHVDVRTLGNSLRGITGNDQAGMIMPAANTNTVVLSGTGQTIANLVDLLNRVESAAAQGGDWREALQVEVKKASAK